MLTLVLCVPPTCPVPGVNARHTGTIDFDEFLQMMAGKLHVPDPREELREAFTVFEAGDGSMPTSELLYVLENSSEELSAEEIQTALKLVDPRNTGRVGFEELQLFLDYTGISKKS